MCYSIKVKLSWVKARSVPFLMLHVLRHVIFAMLVSCTILADAVCLYHTQQEGFWCEGITNIYDFNFECVNHSVERNSNEIWKIHPKLLKWAPTSSNMETSPKLVGLAMVAQHQFSKLTLNPCGCTRTVLTQPQWSFAAPLFPSSWVDQRKMERGLEN